MRTLAPPSRPSALTDQRVEVDGVVYQQEWVKCGKACWCRGAWPERGHGPYWYAYYVDPRTKRWRAVYIGKDFRQI